MSTSTMWTKKTILAATAAICLSSASGPLAASTPTTELRPWRGVTRAAAPPLPAPGPSSVQLVLDDNQAEGSVGITQGAGARQFLWFNRFPSPGPFTLEQIWVLFPIDPGLVAGQSIELVVMSDPDGDPTNGAAILASISATIQVVDGTTFSIYDLAPSVDVPGGGDVLIGVVNRFVTSGVSAPSFPAALDETSTQMRSWVATWTGDPPAPPSLPSDGILTLVDAFPQLSGNWMIRGLGTAPAPAAQGIPAVGLPGLIVLLSLLAALGVRRLSGEGSL